MTRRFASATLLATAMSVLAAACSKNTQATSKTEAQAHEIGVVKVVRKTLARQLVVSSELVPFQQIDVYAKESGFVKDLYVDYGDHVVAGQVMAVLEIPELKMQLDEDEADIKDATDRISSASNEVRKVEAQHEVTHLQYSRLDGVAETAHGLVAQQEVDDKRGADLAVEAAVAAAQANLQSAQSVLARAQATRRRDQALYDYSKIIAPFAGVVTQRYANYGTLIQAGTSNPSAMPLVQLSQENLYRLVIPVSETWVPYVKIGNAVRVRVPSLNRDFPGKVARFSVDVQADTRTMHTEVNVPNPDGILVPGQYAEATLTLDNKANALAVPQEAVNIEGDERSVWLVDASNKVQQRKITIGIETPHNIEVTSGLKEGDIVAVGDRSSLQDGETVRPRLVELIQSPSESERAQREEQKQSGR
jgi:RND family efflux transporter MFP subunit